MADAEQAAATALRDVSLDDKYDLTKDRVFITGTQAIIRMLLMQRERDRARRAEHRRLRLRLSRLADRRPRPEPLARQEVASGERHRLPARPQRGACRDRALGLAAGGAARRRQIRRRLRGLVRQGPGRRPHRRRVPPRQHGGLLEARRRAGADGRRPHRRILDRRASVGIRLRRRDDADPEPGRRPGADRLRPLRLRPEPLLRHLGGAEMRQGQHRVRRRPPTAASTGSRSLSRATTSSACRRAASTSARRTASSSRRRGSRTSSATPCWPSCARTTSTTSSCPAGVSRRSA